MNWDNLYQDWKNTSQSYQSQQQKWKKDDLLTYSHESRDYRERCYDFKDNNLGYNYIFKHKALLEKRLLQGGLRLAGALNRIFNQ